VDAVGLSWATLYSGRRTHISLVIHAGVSPVVVAASVGHTSGETIWKHYARLFDGARTTVAVPMDRAIRAARRAVRRSVLPQVSAESNVIAPRSRS
jgi:integrase